MITHMGADPPRIEIRTVEVVTDENGIATIYFEKPFSSPPKVNVSVLNEIVPSITDVGTDTFKVFLALPIVGYSNQTVTVAKSIDFGNIYNVSSIAGVRKAFPIIDGFQDYAVAQFDYSFLYSTIWTSVFYDPYKAITSTRIRAFGGGEYFYTSYYNYSTTVTAGYTKYVRIPKYTTTITWRDFWGTSVVRDIYSTTVSMLTYVRGDISAVVFFPTTTSTFYGYSTFSIINNTIGKTPLNIYYEVVNAASHNHLAAFQSGYSIPVSQTVTINYIAMGD